MKPDGNNGQLQHHLTAVGLVLGSCLSLLALRFLGLYASIINFME